MVPPFAPFTVSVIYGWLNPFEWFPPALNGIGIDISTLPISRRFTLSYGLVQLGTVPNVYNDVCSHKNTFRFKDFHTEIFYTSKIKHFASRKNSQIYLKISLTSKMFYLKAISRTFIFHNWCIEKRSIRISKLVQNSNPSWITRILIRHLIRAYIW